MAFAAKVASLAGLCLVATATIHAVLHVRAGRRRHHGAGHGLRDGHAASGTRLVLAETAASIWLAWAATRPTWLPLGSAARARRVILLLAPAWLPARALTVLGRRLARADALVDVARLPRRSRPGALARVAARADALRRGRPDRPLAIVCYGGAARSIASLAALLPRGVPDRVVLLAPPARALGTSHPNAVAIRVGGDPLRTEPAGPTIEIAGVGPLALLVAPHVADVVRDACAPVAEPPREGAT